MDRKEKSAGVIDKTAQGDGGSASMEREGKGRAFLRAFGEGTLYALWGYLLSAAALPFGATPFGIALLAAADRRALYVFGGICLWAIGNPDGMVLATVCASVLLIRFLSRFLLDVPTRLRGTRRSDTTVGELFPHLFGEHIALRMATACVGVFALGLWRLRQGGFLFYDLYGTLVSLVVAPVFVLLVSGFFFKEKHEWQYRLGFLSLGTAICFAASDWKLYGISLGAFGAMMTALWVCRRQGVIRGMLTGSLLGLAAAPTLMPSFILGAMAAGLLFPFSVGFGAACSFGLSMTWGYYAQGLNILNGFFPAMLSAHVLFFVCDKLFGREKKIGAEVESETVKEVEAVAVSPVITGERERMRLNDTIRKIRSLCTGFSELGDVFDGLARRMQRPDAADLRQICDRAFDACCTGCPSKEICWGERYHVTSAEIGGLCESLRQKEHLTREDVGEHLSSHCDRMPDILEEINHNAARYTEQLVASDRSEIFAENYRVISRLLASAMAEEDREYEINYEESERLSEALQKKDWGITGVCVTGVRRRRIGVCGRDTAVLSREKEAIRAEAERVLHRALGEGDLCEEEAVLSFCERERIGVRFARLTVRAEGENQYCGDTAEAFFGENGTFYALISDGMGSGQEAALTSGIGGIFLKRLLGLGADSEEILRLLNQFLRNRGSGSLHECSATVDLMELDLMDQRATFYKSGAAPTYVFRDGGLFKLRSRTVPMGIIREPDVKRIGFEMGVGDLVVMVSDGVTQGKEECPWLFDLLQSHKDISDVQRLAELIVKYAKEEGSMDDISVLVIRLEEAKQ